MQLLSLYYDGKLLFFGFAWTATCINILQTGICLRTEKGIIETFGSRSSYISKLSDRSISMNSTREVPTHVIHYYRTKDVTLPPCISRVGTISSATAALLLSILF